MTQYKATAVENKNNQAGLKDKEVEHNIQTYKPKRKHVAHFNQRTTNTLMNSWNGAHKEQYWHHVKATIHGALISRASASPFQGGKDYGVLHWTPCEKWLIFYLKVTVLFQLQHIHQLLQFEQFFMKG